MIIIQTVILETPDGLLVSSRGQNVGVATEMECDAADAIAKGLHEAEEAISKVSGAPVILTPFRTVRKERPE